MTDPRSRCTQKSRTAPRSKRIAELEARLTEAQETLDAIRTGAVDAIVVNGDDGEQIFTLEGAERSYRVLVEAMTEGAATLAADGTLLYCNVRFAQMLARPLNRVMGTSLRKFVDPQHRPTLDALLTEGRKHDSRGEVTLTASGGKQVPTLLSVNAIRSEDGLDKQVLCLVATDLTEQKRNAEMLASERLARSVLEQAGEAIVVCDNKQRIIRASNATHRLAGCNPLLRPFSEVFPFEVEGAPVPKLALSKKAIAGLPVSFTRSDGQPFNLLLSAGPLLGHKGKVLGCIITLTDVSRLKNVEDDLHSAIRARDEFLSIASHELRTPLTALLLQLQSLQHMLNKAFGDKLQERVSHKIEMALRQPGHLSKLIDGLLDVSRITSGRIAQVHEEVELTGFAREVVERCRGEAERAGCILEFDGRQKVIGIWDPMQLEQVLTNLVGNAIKYGPAKPIRVAVEDARPHARITVRDQGIGIAQADTKRIFERFERAVSRQHYGGLGLGLFIASRIVQAYAGTIAVASKQGEGSEFTVSLPRRCA